MTNTPGNGRLKHNRSTRDIEADDLWRIGNDDDETLRGKGITVSLPALDRPPHRARSSDGVSGSPSNHDKHILIRHEASTTKSTRIRRLDSPQRRNRALDAVREQTETRFGRVRWLRERKGNKCLCGFRAGSGSGSHDDGRS